MADMIEKYDRPYTYAVWSKDKEIRFCSTSGGAFTEFAKGIIEKQGVVVGAASVSYTHLRAHETDSYLVCRLLLEKKKITNNCLLYRGIYDI